MEIVKINYSHLESMANGQPLNGVRMASYSNLNEVIDAIQSSLQSVLDTLAEQQGKSIRALEKNIDTMLDSLRGIENNSGEFIESIYSYYDNMTEELLASNEERSIEVSETISDLKKTVKDADNDYNNILGYINFTISGMGANGHLFLKNAEEKKEIITRADARLASANEIITDILTGVKEDFIDLIDELKKLENFVDTDTQMKRARLAGSILKVAAMATITAALGPVGGIVFGACIAAGIAYKNGKSTAEAVAVGALDAVVGGAVGKGLDTGAKFAKKEVKALAKTEFGEGVTTVTKSGLAKVSDLTAKAGETIISKSSNVSGSVNVVSNTIENVGKSKPVAIIKSTADKTGVVITSDYNKSNAFQNNLVAKGKYQVDLQVQNAKLNLLEQLRIVASDSGDDDALAAIDGVIQKQQAAHDKLAIKGWKGKLQESSGGEFGVKGNIVIGTISDPVKGQVINFVGDSLDQVGDKLDELINSVESMQTV